MGAAERGLIGREVIRAFFDQQEKIAMTFGFFDELSKLAADEPTFGEGVLRGVDTARPYVHRAAIGAVPGAVLGTAVGHLRPRQGWFPVGGALLGAGIGAADQALEDLAERRRFRHVLTSYREKQGALAEDARRTHVGGANAPTEVSKGFAVNQLRSAQDVGKFQNAATNRTVKRVGTRVQDLV